MSSLLATAAALTLAVTGGAVPASAQDAPLYLTGGTVVDVASGELRSGVDVVVRDGRIRRVAPSEEVGSPPDGARVVELDGRYVLPGLIDAHTHLGGLASARRALESGVTTARAVGVGGYRDVAIREMARAGTIAGPELLSAGVFVTPELGDAVLADSRLAPFHVRDVRSPEDLRRV
ncbi:MAG: amidohydrolase, partial [Gemmatimonadota bacterium]